MSAASENKRLREEIDLTDEEEAILDQMWDEIVEAGSVEAWRSKKAEENNGKEAQASS